MHALGDLVVAQVDDLQLLARAEAVERRDEVVAQPELLERLAHVLEALDLLERVAAQRQQPQLLHAREGRHAVDLVRREREPLAVLERRERRVQLQ